MALDTGLYYLTEGKHLDHLLAGGDKSSTSKDIDEALLLADNLKQAGDLHC